MTGAEAAPGQLCHEASFQSQRQDLLVWVDGQLVPRGRATISVFDRAAHFGDGVFEGIRAYNGRVFKLRSHLERLARSARGVRIDLPLSLEDFESLIRRTLEANGLDTAYIRLVVTRGPGTLGLGLAPCTTPSVFCITAPLTLFDEAQRQRGLSAAVVARPRIPVRCLDPRVKTCNYLNNILAQAEARDAGADEAVLLNVDGFVAEAAGENLFVVKAGALATPPPEAGILEGITRKVVMDLARGMGLDVQERNIAPQELRDADEVFLTGTGAEVVAVTRLDGAVVGEGVEGPVTRRLREAFFALVSEDAPED